MRYLPKSPADREAMLKAIGLRSVDELFAPIPAEYRLNRDLKIPRQMAESEIVDFFRERSQENGEGYTSFLGAGAYAHYRPVIIDSLISRGEFLTAYTPYQAEISQGTLQSIFEFQSMICELTGMEVANASMYDGSTAAAEAVMMAVRLTGRRSVVAARSLHPEYREVLATYATHQGMPLTVAGFGDDGRLMSKKLHFFASDAPDAQAALTLMRQRYEDVGADSCEIIVALGGDGFMLQTLHKFLDADKPISSIIFCSSVENAAGRAWRYGDWRSGRRYVARGRVQRRVLRVAVSSRAWLLPCVRVLTARS